MSYVVQHPTHLPPPYCIGFCFNLPPRLPALPQSSVGQIWPSGRKRVIHLLSLCASDLSWLMLLLLLLLLLFRAIAALSMMHGSLQVLQGTH